MILHKRKERSRCSLRRRVALPTSSLPPFPSFNSNSIWTLKKDHRTGHMLERTNGESKGVGNTVNKIRMLVEARRKKEGEKKW